MSNFAREARPQINGSQIVVIADNPRQFAQSLAQDGVVFQRTPEWFDRTRGEAQDGILITRISAEEMTLFAALGILELRSCDYNCQYIHEEEYSTIRMFRKDGGLVTPDSVNLYLVNRI